MEEHASHHQDLLTVAVNACLHDSAAHSQKAAHDDSASCAHVAAAIVIAVHLNPAQRETYMHSMHSAAGQKSNSTAAVLQGPTQKRSRTAVTKTSQHGVAVIANHAAAAGAEKKMPVLSVSCLCRLLHAVTDRDDAADGEVEVWACSNRCTITLIASTQVSVRLRISQPGKTQLVPHTPGTLAGDCNPWYYHYYGSFKYT